MFREELRGRGVRALIASAVIVEQFLRDGGAVESRASVSFRFVPRNYRSDGGGLCCLVMKSTGSGLEHTGGGDVSPQLLRPSSAIFCTSNFSALMPSCVQWGR